MNKLLLVGSNTIHTYNYYKLIEDYFDEVFIITDDQNDNFKDVPHMYVCFSFRKFYKINNTIDLIRKKIKDYDPSIIHIHQAGTEAWLTLKASKELSIPSIVTAWGSDILLTPEKGKLYQKMLIYILKKADYFTCDSAFVAAKMLEIEGSGKLKLTIANFGIDMDLSDEVKENIIYSNRLHKRLYRIDAIIKSFKQFISSRSDENWRLIIAASGEETENLKAMVSNLGIDEFVSFPGWVGRDQNHEYYKKAKIFVSVPESDATSISLLEAMAAGCIPVLSNLPANHEWVIDGLNGIIVTDYTQNFLDKAMSIDANKLIELNHSIIEKKGTKAANKKIFVSLYNDILNS